MSFQIAQTSGVFWLLLLVSLSVFSAVKMLEGNAELAWQILGLLLSCSDYSIERFLGTYILFSLINFWLDNLHIDHVSIENAYWT